MLDVVRLWGDGSERRSRVDALPACSPVERIPRVQPPCTALSRNLQGLAPALAPGPACDGLGLQPGAALQVLVPPLGAEVPRTALRRTARPGAERLVPPPPAPPLHCRLSRILQAHRTSAGGP